MSDFILIFMDENIDEIDDHMYKSIDLLQDIINSIKLFTDFNQCIHFINETTDKNLVMITSEKHIQQLIPVAQQLIQLDSIYILCKENLIHEEYTEQCKKVRGVYDNVAAVCDVLKQDINRRDTYRTSINIILPSSTTNPNELDPSFMYSQLLKEIFLDTIYDDKEKEEFVKYCRDRYLHENNKTKIINEFGEKYDQQSAIWWYTRDVFIYEILNGALRTQETEVILRMGFFLRDLHRQIERLYSELNNSNRLTIFRGQGMLKAEFEKMKNNEGGLLSFNCFLSTTSDYEVAHFFADSILQDTNLIAIVFRIEIDSFKSPTPFASVREFSYFPKVEDEYLFSMNSIFRIGETKEIKDRLWQTNLTLTTDNDEQLIDLTKHFRKKIKGPTALHRLGQLMINMSQYDKAEEIIRTLIGTTPDSDELMLVNLHHQLGFVKSEKGEWENALRCYEKALEGQNKCLPHNHPEISVTYSNIGLVQDAIGNYPQALAYYEKALEIQQKSTPLDDISIAITYHNIGVVYYFMRQCLTALSYCQDAIRNRQIFAPVNDPVLANIYNTMGGVHSEMGEYSRALDYYKKALEIQRKSLSFNHPFIIISLKNISSVYNSMEDTSKAIEFCEKICEIQQKSPPTNRLDLAISYSNNSFLYYLMGEYSKALSCLDKVRQVQENLLPSNHSSLAITYNNMAFLYNKKKDNLQALFYLEKTLEIEKKSLPADHATLATTYNNIGFMYQSMQDYFQALVYYEKALEINEKSLQSNHVEKTAIFGNIASAHYLLKDYSAAILYYGKRLQVQQTSLPNNHLALATTYKNLATVYQSKEEYQTALYYFEKAFEIQQISLPPDHPSLIDTYSYIGFMHYSMEDYSTALIYYEKLLEIQLKTSPNDHAALASTYKTTAFIHGLLGDQSKSASYFAKMFEMQRALLLPNTS